MQVSRVTAGYYLTKVPINGVERTVEIERVKAQYIGYGWTWKLDGITSKPFTNLDKAKQDIKQFLEQKDLKRQLRQKS